MCPLYRFPIGGLSPWSLGWDGEDKPVDLSSSSSSWVRQQDKDMVTHLKLSASDKPVCVRARVRVNERCWCRGGWRAGSDLHHISDFFFYRGLLWHLAVTAWGWVMLIFSLIYRRDTSAKVAAQFYRSVEQEGVRFSHFSRYYKLRVKSGSYVSLVLVACVDSELFICWFFSHVPLS